MWKICWSYSNPFSASLRDENKDWIRFTNPSIEHVPALKYTEMLLSEYSCYNRDEVMARQTGVSCSVYITVRHFVQSEYKKICLNIYQSQIQTFISAPERKLQMFLDVNLILFYVSNHSTFQEGERTGFGS